MHERVVSRWRFAAASALALALAGCVVAPVGPYGYGPYDGAYGVPVAPPPPQAEYIGPPPAAGYIWLNGFWGWSGGRHVWQGGHWEAPRPGYHWTPHSWSHEGGGWREHGGHWGR